MFSHAYPDHYYSSSIAHPPPPLPASRLPRPGHTRCYWALLSPNLEFLYIDPVFRSHLGPQGDAIIRTRLLDFVHPDEHASAQQDLGKVLDNRVLHGSVTRVRYSRLGRARARLGYTGPREKFAGEDKVSFDEDYMAADLVINWAADSLVLCFIHAVVDLCPQDNDEKHRTPWTNWCGTPELSQEETDRLLNALGSCLPQTSQVPTRVFQILENTADRPVLVSWPAHGYYPADYARLADNVDIGGANDSDAKTSCTRRYKAQHMLHGTDVESIFIPYGHIIFACYTAMPHRFSHQSRPSNSYPLYPTGASLYDQSQHHYNQYGSRVAESYPTVSAGHTYSYPAHQDSATHQTYPIFQSSFPIAGRNSPPPSLRNSATQSYHQESQFSSTMPHTSTYLERHSPVEQRESSTALIDEVPPPRQRGSRLSPALGSSRGGQPPPGITMCAACKSMNSPEWRKGPSGKKDLCNACGLRYSRNKAKKEGIPPVKRRKDGLKEEESESTPSSSSKRKNYSVSLVYPEFALEGHHQSSFHPTIRSFSPHPVEYPNNHVVQTSHHEHTISTGPNLYYPSNARHAPMYFMPSNHPSSSAYTHQPRHQHQQSHHHTTSTSPISQMNSEGSHLSGSSSSGPSTGPTQTTPISSYERTSGIQDLPSHNFHPPSPHGQQGNNSNNNHGLRRNEFGS